MSSLDKTLTNAYYEIEIHPTTRLPVKIAILLLTGTREGTVMKDKKIIGGRHVAFHFEYELSNFGKLKTPKIPPEAEKLLAKK